MNLKKRFKYWKEIVEGVEKKAAKIFFWVTMIMWGLLVILVLVFFNWLQETFDGPTARALVLMLLCLLVILTVWYFICRRDYFFAALVPFDDIDREVFERLVLRKNNLVIIIYLVLFSIMLFFVGYMAKFNVGLSGIVRVLLSLPFHIVLSIIIASLYFIKSMKKIIREVKDGLIKLKSLKRILAVISLRNMWNLVIFDFCIFLLLMILGLIFWNKIPERTLGLVAVTLGYLILIMTLMFISFSIWTIIIPGIIIWGAIPTLIGVGASLILTIILPIVISGSFDWRLALFIFFTCLISWDGFFMLRRGELKKKILAFFLVIVAIAIAFPVTFFLSWQWGGVEPLQTVALVVSVMVSLSIDTWMATYIT